MLSEGSLFSGASRAHALARWLAEPPEGSVSLVIAVQEQGASASETLARWQVPVVDSEAWGVISTEWAGRIETLLSDYVADLGQSAVAVLRWLDGGGNPLASRRIKLRAPKEAESLYQQEASLPAAMAQLMAHQQVLMENLTAITQHSVTQSARLADDSQERLEKLARENARLREELAETRAEQVEDAAAQTIRENSERDPVADKAEKLLEVVAMKWLAANASGAVSGGDSGGSPVE